jgi:hypothetical protein
LQQQHQQQRQHQQQQATTDAFSTSTQQAERSATDNASSSEAADGTVTAPAAASQGSKGVSKQRAKPQAAAAVLTRCALDGLQFAFSDVRVIEGKFAAYRITLMVPVTSEQLQLLADDSTVTSSSSNGRNSNRQSAITHH